MLRRAFTSSAALRAIMENALRNKLTKALAPTSLEITNDSHLHAGHAAMRAQGGGSGETHFTVSVVSQAFENKRTLERHRLVNDAVSEEFKNGLHALIIKAKTPEEISKAAASS